MDYNVKNGDRIATITLDGTECAVKFSSRFNVFEVINKSSEPVLMALVSGAAKGDDGTYTIPTGDRFGYPHMRQLDTVYLTGSGEITVIAKNDTNPSFKSALAGGQGGGGTEELHYSAEDKLLCNLDCYIDNTTSLGTVSFNKNVEKTNDIVTIEACYILREFNNSGAVGIYNLNNVNGIVVALGTPSEDKQYLNYAISLGSNHWEIESTGKAIPVKIGEMHTFSMVFNSANVSLYSDGVFQKTINYGTSARFPDVISQLKFMSRYYSGRDGIGNLYSLRVFDTGLTEEEIAHNYAVDKSIYGN